jgi:UDP-glucuronate decarboxylase
MKHSNPETVIVTGAAGNIGSALCSALCADGRFKVIAVDDLSTGSRCKLPENGERFRFIKADVNDFGEISAIFLSAPVRWVFHFAAVVGVQRTLSNPLKVLRDIDGIRNVLSLSKNGQVSRVFYSSSSEVYGEPVSIPQHEYSTPLNSRLPYAIVKNLGEAFFKSFHEEHGLPYTIFRFFNTYGPNQSEDFVVPKLLRAAMQGKPLTIYGDGQQTRTFCYIDDNVETMMRCLIHDHCVNDVMNIGSDVEMSIVELARLIKRLSGSDSPIEHLPPLKEGDMTRRKPDIAKMMELLGRPLVPVDVGIQRLIDHWQRAPVRP